MKMTLKDVKKNLNALAGLGGATYPSKLSFAISRNIDKLQREDNHTEEERKKLCERYADKDKEGKAVMVDCVINGQKTQKYKMSDENQQAFDKEYEDLLNEEVDVDIHMVKQEVIEQCEAVERYTIPTVANIVALDFMIE